jgi:hypothetical protein
VLAAVVAEGLGVSACAAAPDALQVPAAFNGKQHVFDGKKYKYKGGATRWVAHNRVNKDRLQAGACRAACMAQTCPYHLAEQNIASCKLITQPRQSLCKQHPPERAEKKSSAPTATPSCLAAPLAIAARCY